MIHLDSVLKSEDITSSTKVHMIQAMVFPVVMYGWRLDSKESKVPKNLCFWTVVLEKTLETPLESKEIKPVNLDGNQPWILFGRTDAETPKFWPPDGNCWPLEKTLMLGKIEGRRRRGWQRMRWLNGITYLLDMNLGKIWEMMKDREAWHTVTHGVTKSQTELGDWTNYGNVCLRIK